MAVSVSASDLQKNFGEWHDKAYEGPVEITRYGRTTAYLVSAKLYRDMLASYRRAVHAWEISDDEMALIRNSVVETDEPYKLDDPRRGADERPGRLTSAGENSAQTAGRVSHRL